jgi:regulator of sirC expression with transglutaminase-like and TPR domain
VLKKAYAKKPKTPGLAYRMGRTYQDLDKRSLAVRFYNKAIKHDPQDPMPHYYLGHIFKAYGNNNKAYGEFRRYLQLRPDAPDADEVKEEMDYLRR